MVRCIPVLGRRRHAAIPGQPAMAKRSSGSPLVSSAGRSAIPSRVATGWPPVDTAGSGDPRRPVGAGFRTPPRAPHQDVREPGRAHRSTDRFPGRWSDVRQADHRRSSSRRDDRGRKIGPPLGETDRRRGRDEDVAGVRTVRVGHGREESTVARTASTRTRDEDPASSGPVSGSSGQFLPTLLSASRDRTARQHVVR